MRSASRCRSPRSACGARLNARFRGIALRERRRYASLNFTCAWVPSQNGLFCDCPQRHSVTRLRTSYSKPSADTTGIPPRNQSGPLHSWAGSSMRPIDTGSSGSIGFRFSVPCNEAPGRAVPDLANEHLPHDRIPGLFHLVPDLAIGVAEPGERAEMFRIHQDIRWPFDGARLFKIRLPARSLGSSNPPGRGIRHSTASNSSDRICKASAERCALFRANRLPHPWQWSVWRAAHLQRPCTVRPSYHDTCRVLLIVPAMRGARLFRRPGGIPRTRQRPRKPDTPNLRPCC